MVQSVAAQYGLRPAAQAALPWPEWALLVAGLQDDTPLGRVVAVRQCRGPEARRLTPRQRAERARWQRFLAARAAARGPAARREQHVLQQALARMFGENAAGESRN